MGDGPTAPTGRVALDQLCELAHRQRSAHPLAGAAEAADLQWRSRTDLRETPGTTLVWHDRLGPIAAVFTTRFRRGVDLDVICLDDHRLDDCRTAAAELVAGVEDADVITAFQHDDPDWTAWAFEQGFVREPDVVVGTWRDAAPPALSPLPAGYTLTSRAERPDRPHHMMDRNGPEVARRLATCSLYRPDHDLFVLGPDGDVAAYGLFWADSVTGVGLIEPMRTEDAHQGRGLARAVLAEGMRRLTAAGCRRLKVSYFVGNAPAERLYLGLGFTPTDRSRFLIRRAPR